MATKLKNIINNYYFKIFLYFIFGILIFFASYYAMSSLTCDKKEHYFKNFAYESFFIDDFYESSYTKNIMDISFTNLEKIAEEFTLPEYNGQFKSDKINLIDKNFEFKNNQHPFCYDKKYSYYFETTDGIAFASSDLKGMSKSKIKNYIKSKKLFSWLDYRIDGMGIDADSTSKLVKHEINLYDYNSNFAFGNLASIRVLYVAYNDNIIDIAQNEWKIAHLHYKNLKNNLKIILLLCFLIILLLIIGAGNKLNCEEKLELFFDKVFIELKLLIGIIAYNMIHYKLMDYFYTSNFTPHFNIYKLFSSFIITAFMYIFLILGLSIIRNLKSEKLKYRFLTSFVVIFIIKLFNILNSFFSAVFHTKNISSSNINKQIHKYINNYVLTSAIIIIFSLSLVYNKSIELVIICLFLESIITVFFILKVKKLLILSDNEFKKRIKEASKSEKTKTELITNVSHDLKTPLTSLIGYIDLLKKEEITDVAKDYVKILEQKTNKLKDMIEDLFVLSKSESGSIDIDMQIIDFNKLLKQTLASMEDKIKKSGMNIKLISPNTGVYIKSDGKKLYRVLQNLIDNSLKYSLKDTRIFIELDISVDNKVMFRIKNTSSYEMNFTKEDITARFVRGDKSRSKEGSGLGLAIVESFVGILGGDFDLIIDGDLFIVDLGFEMIKG